jgi:hypothetical protein
MSLLLWLLLLGITKMTNTSYPYSYIPPFLLYAVYFNFKLIAANIMDYYNYSSSSKKH